MKMKLIKDFHAANAWALKVREENIHRLDMSMVKDSDCDIEKLDINFNLDELADDLMKLAKKAYPKPKDGYSKGGHPNQDYFLFKGRNHKGDAILDEAVLELLAEEKYAIPESVGLRPEFWNTFQLQYVPHLVYGYRHPPLKEDAKFNVDNLASQLVYKNYLGRTWLRLALTKDDDGVIDLDLASRGQVDFWRSHIFGQKSVWGRRLIRAFVKYQYPNKKEIRLLEKSQSGENTACEGIRFFIKQLAGSTSTMCLDIMSEEDLLKHMDELTIQGDIRYSEQWRKDHIGN